MLIFCKDLGVLRAIPQERIFQIYQTQNVVNIDFNDGSYTEDGIHLICNVKIHYETVEDAVKKMKDFYWSLSKNTNAFMF